MIRNLFTVLFILLLIFTLPLYAQKFSFSGAGGFVGAVFPSDWDTGFHVGGGVSLGQLTTGLYLFPNLDYWSAGAEQEDEVEVGMSNFAINVDVHYFFDGVQEGAYAGAGLSYNMLSWEYSYISYPSGSRYWVDEGSDEIGFQPLAGYLFYLGSINGFIEGKYNLISDFNTFQITLGVLFGKK